MHRFTHQVMVWGWRGLVVLSLSVQGQAPAPGTTPGPAVVAGDLNALVQQLGDRVRQLGDQVTTELGNFASGPILLRDTRELAQAIDEFRQALPNAPDTLRRRRLFS